MGSLYRSVPMRQCQLIVQKEAAYSCVAELGKLANVHFNDLNDGVYSFRRKFVKEVSRCAELERSLRFLEKQIYACEPKISVEPVDFTDLTVANPRALLLTQTELSDVEKDVRFQIDSMSQMRRTLSEMLEFHHVLQKVECFFDVHLDDEALQAIEEAREQTEQFEFSFTPRTEQDSEFAWFITGVLPQEKRCTFERVLWRACRQTAFVRDADIDDVFEDPITGEVKRKCVFIVFFKGDKLREVINKVCDGFMARQYPCPMSNAERKKTAVKVWSRVNDLRIILTTSQRQHYSVLEEVAKLLPRWQKQVYLQKAVYHALNMFTYDTSGKFFVMECWIPRDELAPVRAALDKGVEDTDSTFRPLMNELETCDSAPTYFRTNTFTQPFQAIVDAYGIPSYREINPASFSIVTFPFLFAIMFGDSGHGLIMVLAAVALISVAYKIDAKGIKNEIFAMFFTGRFIILLMGLFSMYSGAVYNDWFAKPLNIFGTAWRNPYSESKLNAWVAEAGATGKNILLIPDPKTAYSNQFGPFPFGVDPIWHIAENRLSFLNSMKMKAAVLIGVIQMTFGVVLSFLNFRFSNSVVDVLTNFMPRIVFLLSIFGYLCVQIVLKWVYFSAHEGYIFGYYYPGSHCAPALLLGMINMFMLTPKPAGIVNSSDPTLETGKCHLSQWYPYQSLVETVLLTCAISCVPVMFFGRPLCVLAARLTKRDVLSKTADARAEEGIPLNEIVAGKAERKAAGSKKTDSRDVMIHQVIGTVEFVLGCVSHCASYLRLWALSLAHSQLSEVLWHMVLSGAFVYSGTLGGVALYLLFAVFAVFTVAIVVVMEGLSAFLHSLRLHWVEFQSKFYEGGGYSFVPFSLLKSLQKSLYVSEEG